jgi:hypothetical protein
LGDVIALEASFGFLATRSIVVSESAAPEGLVFRANVLPHNEYGMIGRGSRPPVVP